MNARDITVRYDTIAVLRVPDYSDAALADYNNVLASLTIAPLHFYAEGQPDQTVRVERILTPALPRWLSDLVRGVSAFATESLRFGVTMRLSLDPPDPGYDDIVEESAIFNTAVRGCTTCCLLLIWQRPELSLSPAEL